MQATTATVSTEAAKKRKSNEGKAGKAGGNGKVDSSPVALPVLEFPVAEVHPAAADFYGHVKQAFDPEWSLNEPFILTSQQWFKDLDGMDKLKQWLQDFQSAFEISSFRATVGRAQKRLSEDTQAVVSFLLNIKNAIPAAEMLFPVASEGIDQDNFKELASSCDVSAFVMRGASHSPPGFETGEVAFTTARKRFCSHLAK